MKKYNNICSLALVVLMLISFTAHAGPKDQAKRMHDRIAGVPADDAKLNEMAALISTDAIAAAELATEHPAFYNVTLKNFVTPWTNEPQTVFAPLNDYTATVIGIVRDDRDFRQVLFDDVLYVGKSGLGLPAYSNSNNNHYEALESQGHSLFDSLEFKQQSVVTGLPANATAGVMTTRAAAKAFFIDGTNRAMLRFTFLNHLCNDLEQIKDVTRSPDRVRQDVSRSPGGDSRIYMNSCVGCHAGMDPLAQAYAYYNYEYDVDTDEAGEFGRLDYNASGDIDPDTGMRVQAKYHINATNFKYGYATPDDRWDNYWRNGPNAVLGWDTNSEGVASGGYGAKTMGVELANSEAFASCQVKKVFKTVCFNEPTNAQLSTLTTSFKNNDYKLKRVFAESAVMCMGD